MIERLQRENQINIFDFIAQMRRERHAMVQTLVREEKLVLFWIFRNFLIF